MSDFDADSVSQSELVFRFVSRERAGVAVVLIRIVRQAFERNDSFGWDFDALDKHAERFDAGDDRLHLFTDAIGQEVQ